MDMNHRMKSLIKDSFQRFPIPSTTDVENKEIQYKFGVETIINNIFQTLYYTPITEAQLTSILEIFLTESFWNESSGKSGLTIKQFIFNFGAINDIIISSSIKQFLDFCEEYYKEKIDPANKK
jgi:hypothetical protein